MSTITRVTKVGSGTTEFAPGTTILSNEVNTDFDRIYQDYDGFIDNTNIAASAGIVYSKLNLTNSIVNADINTAAGIVGTKLADAPLGVTTAKINDGAVTAAKLALNATIANNVIAPVPTDVEVTTSEVTLFDTPPFTSRGSTVLLLGTAMFKCLLGGAAGIVQPTLTVRLYTCQPAPVFLTAINLVAARTSTTGEEIEVPGSIPFTFIDSPVASATFYRVTVQSTVDQNVVPLGEWRTVAANAGALIVLQLS